MTNKIAILNPLLNIKLARDADVGDHAMSLESKSNRLASMKFEIKEPMNRHSVDISCLLTGLHSNNSIR